MLTPLADTLWVAQQPTRFLGLRFGARMTVLGLPDGGLLLHSPIEITDDLAADINAIGPVRHILAPNLFHHLFVGSAAARWPEATTWGPVGLAAKRPDLSLSATLGTDPFTVDGLTAVTLPGMPRLAETVLHHPASGSLITTDLVLNITDARDAWTRFYLWANGISGKPGVSKVIATALQDRAALRRSFDDLLALDFDRLVIAHGDVIEERGRAVLQESYAWMK